VRHTNLAPMYSAIQLSDIIDYKIIYLKKISIGMELVISNGKMDGHRPIRTENKT
jgi:hypothetical protein